MQKEVKHAIQTLLNKELILYPTDTIWGIGCNATSKKAVKKVYKLKQRKKSKSLIVLVDSIKMLKNYVEFVPEKALELISSEERPLTIIYQNPKNLAKNLIAKDNTIAIRIVSKGFCNTLIQQFGKPIVSTSANMSGEPNPKNFSEIDNTILKGVHYVVNLPNEQNNTAIASKIVKIDDQGLVHTIRD